MLKDPTGEFCTTKSLTTEPPGNVIKPEQRAGTILRLPEGPGRQGEGGMRTQNLFKASNRRSPLVSVITVVFNNHEHIEQTIKNVIEQTYDNVEYIVIDGGSTDGTLEVIESYSGAIDYWVSEKDLGLYDAMNKAIKVSSGDWLNFMNSGDLYVNKDILSQTMVYATPSTEVIYSDYYRYTEGADSPRLITCDADRLYVLHQSMVYRRSLHDLHGLYLAGKGLLISDYLFFNLLDRNTFVKSQYPISQNLEGGMSSTMAHMREKNAVDYLFNNVSFARMIIIVTTEILGRSIKRLFR